MSYLEHQAAYPPPSERIERAIAEGRTIEVPAESSVAFVLSRLNDETLVFSIEFDGQEPGEEMARATHDEQGWDGIDLLERTVMKTAAAIGAKVVRR